MVQNRIIKLISATTSFFILLFLIRHYFELSLINKNSFTFTLIVGLTIFLYYYFSSSVKLFRDSLICLIILLFQFEFFKFFEFKSGLLPKYNDVPYYVSLILSAMAITIYLGFIWIITKLVSKIKIFK